MRAPTMRLTTCQSNIQMRTPSTLGASFLITVTTGDTCNSNKYAQFKSRYVEPVRYVELGGPLYERPCTAKSALTPGGGRVHGPPMSGLVARVSAFPYKSNSFYTNSVCAVAHTTSPLIGGPCTPQASRPHKRVAHLKTQLKT